MSSPLWDCWTQCKCPHLHGIDEPILDVLTHRGLLDSIFNVLIPKRLFDIVGLNLYVLTPMGLLDFMYMHAVYVLTPKGILDSDYMSLPLRD
jgi:hypothetical protein